MRLSQFWELMRDEFGASYAKSVAREQHLTALAGQTVEEALAHGLDPQRVWAAVCDHMDVPEHRRLGADPPRP